MFNSYKGMTHQQESFKIFPSNRKKVNKSESIKIDYQADSWQNDSDFFSGNNSPVFEERYVKNLEVTGELPEWLNGVYMRNGPNPHFSSEKLTFPYDGDGMLHAIYFEKGGVAYRNKWIKTEELEAEKRAGKSLWNSVTSPNFLSRKTRKKYNAPNTPVKNTANTNVIQHGGHILAMYEGGIPYKISENLETLGTFDYDGQVKGMIAHPRTCPVTGELHFLQYSIIQYPFLRYYVISPKGKVIKDVPIYTKGVTLLHDMILTPNYIVFFACPMYLSLFRAMMLKNPMQWRPKKGTRIGVIPRNGNSKKVTWIEAEPYFVWHIMNGFEENGNIIVDYIKHEYQANTTTVNHTIPLLHRLKLNLQKGIISDNAMDDQNVEFPNINPRMTGKKYRFGYTTKTKKNDLEIGHFTEMVQYDFEDNIYKTFRLPKGYTVGEPTFVPHPYKKEEAEGVVVTFVHDINTNLSKLVILDPLNFDKAPIATVSLPFRVPNGFHGDWVGF